MNKAEIIKTNVPFPSEAALIAPVGIPCDARYIFTRELKCDKKPGNAVMIVCGSDCFDVFINGRAAATYAVRSYVFYRAYEAYDVTDFLCEGKNEVIVKYIDKKAPVFRGFVCEFIIDGSRQNLPFWFYDRDRSRTFVPRYISGGGAEIVDFRRAPNMNSIRYGDTFTEAVRLDLPSDVSLYQSRQDAQVSDNVFPIGVGISDISSPSGDVLTFDAKSGAVIFSAFSHSAGEVIPKNIHGTEEFFIDGKKSAGGERIEIGSGEHIFSASLSGGICSFSLVGAELGEFKAVYAPEKERRYTYPWNEKIQTYKTYDTLVEEAEKHGGCGKIPDDAENIYPTDSVWHDILSYDFDGKIKCDMKMPRDNMIVISKSENNRVITVDFGLERVGFLKIDADCPRNAEIGFFTYELLNKGVPRKMGEKSCGKIIFASGKCEFTSERLRGFRYATLIIPSDTEIKDLSVSVIETKYRTSDVGAFESSDEKLNRIYKMSVDTASVCMLDSYVDCPGYEQNIWVGDAAITGMINMINFGEREFDARYLDMIAQSMKPGLRTYYRGSNPLYVNDIYLPCACFPTYPDGGIPIWSFSWVLHVLDHYMYFGKDEGFDLRLAAVEECLRRAEAHFTPRGLFAPNGAWNLIDWANNDLSPYGEVSANNMMLYGCYTSVSKVFRSIGQTEKADEYSKKAEALKKAINNYCRGTGFNSYVDTVRDVYGYASYFDFCMLKKREPETYVKYYAARRESVQTATFAILFDVADEWRKDFCEMILLDDVKRGNYRRGTPANRTFGTPDDVEAPGGIVRIGTPFFLYYVLAALFKLGRRDEALALIKREWGAMLDDGLTTCVEAFKDERGEWGRSIAHAWSAAPAVYLKSEILGIKPIEPGYKKFTVEPHPCGLTHAKGAVATPYGKIYVEWTVDGDIIRGKIDAPPECERV